MEDNIEIIEEEVRDGYSNDNLFNITSWGADITLRELVSSYEEGDIIKPELQRKYVWEKPEASRFIESILLGLPVPSIFLANSKDNRKLIVDGYQRTMTIVDFMNGIWSKDNTSFRLTNSERINERWRNKTYADLSSEDQRRFRLYTIHAIIFEQKTPRNDDGLYQIFERINTSGKTLNPQEIRNCVYQGNLNTHLFEVNRLARWRALFGEESENARMLDMEFILRFYALANEPTWKNTNGNIVLKKLLNDYMCKYVDAEEGVIESHKISFEQVIDFLYDRIGEDVFHNLQNDLVTIRKKFNPTVFDSIMIATRIALDRGYNKEDNLRPRRLLLLRDPSYRESITQGTMRHENIKNRVELALNYLFEMTLTNEQH